MATKEAFRRYLETSGVIDAISTGGRSYNGRQIVCFQLWRRCMKKKTVQRMRLSENVVFLIPWKVNAAF